MELFSIILGQEEIGQVYKRGSKPPSASDKMISK